MSAMLALAACMPADAVREAPVDAGLARSFDAPFEAVVAATLDSLIALKLSVRTEERVSSLHIQVAKTQTAFSWGEVGRVIIERRPAPPTPVHVFWEKRMRVQLTGTDQQEFARDLYKGIDERLTR
jgi:hypothetical protein